MKHSILGSSRNLAECVLSLLLGMVLIIKNDVYNKDPAGHHHGKSGENLLAMWVVRLRLVSEMLFIMSLYSAGLMLE